MKLIHLSALVIVFELYQINGNREKRFLIFPRAGPTRHQFIGGLGIPIELQQEAVTIGYVWKTQYFLPWNASQLRPANNDTDNDRRRRDLANDLNGDKFEQYDVEAKEVGNEALKEQDADFMTTDKFRWIVYQSIESILYRRNFDGKQCLLRAICEHAESPITPKCGLLGEIFHILLAPSSTVLNENMNDYMAAENFGQAGEPCGEIFKNCRYSLLEIFTQNKI